MLKIARPAFYRPKEGEVVDLVWSFPDEAYPAEIAYALDAQQHPDPFSQHSNRVCHHTIIHMIGLGWVDLGWMVTGEPAPEKPVVDVAVSPALVNYFRGQGLVEGRQSLKGKGKLWNEWCRCMYMLKSTVACCAGMLTDQLAHPGVVNLRDHFAANAKLTEDRAVVTWKGMTLANMVTRMCEH